MWDLTKKKEEQDITAGLASSHSLSDLVLWAVPAQTYCACSHNMGKLEHLFWCMQHGRARKLVLVHATWVSYNTCFGACNMGELGHLFWCMQHGWARTLVLGACNMGELWVTLVCGACNMGELGHLSFGACCWHLSLWCMQHGWARTLVIVVHATWVS